MRILRPILFIAPFILMLAIQLNSQQQVQIDLQNLEQEIGDVIDVPLSISTSGLLVGTYRIDVEYDQSALQAISVVGQSPWSVVKNINEAGIVKLAGLNSNGQHTDFIGATLQFEIIGLPGQLSYLDIFVFDVTDPNGVDLLYESNNGQVAINCTDQIHIGNPQFQQIDKGVFRSNLSLSSDVIVNGTVNTVQFRAGETVNLVPNFAVHAGSTFEAQIRDCQDLNYNYRNRTDRYNAKINIPTSSIKQSNAHTQDIHRVFAVPQLGQAIEINNNAN